VLGLRFKTLGLQRNQSQTSLRPYLVAETSSVSNIARGYLISNAQNRHTFYQLLYALCGLYFHSKWNQLCNFQRSLAKSTWKFGEVLQKWEVLKMHITATREKLEQYVCDSYCRAIIVLPIRHPYCHCSVWNRSVDWYFLSFLRDFLCNRKRIASHFEKYEFAELSNKRYVLCHPSNRNIFVYFLDASGGATSTMTRTLMFHVCWKF